MLLAHWEQTRNEHLGRSVAADSVNSAQVQLVMLAGVNFSKAGDYVFAVQTGGDEKRTIPFLVNEPPQGVG